MLKARNAVVMLALALSSEFGQAAPEANACMPPFETGIAQVTASDPARPGRPIGVRLAYPTRNGVAVEGCAFPVLSFGHGFLIPASAYAYLEQALPREGYLLALAETESGLSPSHAAFAADLAAIPRWLRADPVWSARVGPYYAVGGHSMGGGAAMLAAASSPRPTAMLGLAPANTNPSAIAAAAQVYQPVLLLTGGLDCVTPTVQHAGPMFANLATDAARRQLLEFAQGTHCRFSDGSSVCALGELGCPTASVPAIEQRHWAVEQILDFLDAWLRQDPVFRGDFGD